MGFVAEELNETERLNIQRNKVNNMAVVYGKEASMWKVGVTQTKRENLDPKCISHILVAYFEAVRGRKSFHKCFSSRCL